MYHQSYANAPGYLIIFVGTILSLISAFVPHFDAGYRLLSLVFITGMLPYAVYGIAVPLLRGTLVILVGVIIVVAHSLLVINQRFAANIDYSEGLIYLGPVAIAVAAVPLAIIAIQKSGKYP